MLTETEKERILDRLLSILYAERGKPVPALKSREKADAFRALCNVRPPQPVSEEFLRLQDEYLSSLTEERGVVRVADISAIDGVAVWRGDITRLDADAVVNAGNPALLGCFRPLHACIDNVIHSYAGVQVRLACDAAMGGGEASPGEVRVTGAYDLPSRYIFHTVGPQIAGAVTERDKADLARCYLSCLDVAAEMELASIAFCCISTGVYRFPNDEACRVAVNAVRGWQKRHGSRLTVIFDVFTEKDWELYRAALSERG